ncbi:hypothetical protein GCM10010160_40570 [Acrocarpospora corrugata]
MIASVTQEEPHPKEYYRPQTEQRTQVSGLTTKAGHMDAEVGLNGGGDSVALAGPQLRHRALAQPTQTFGLGRNAFSSSASTYADETEPRCPSKRSKLTSAVTT